MLRRPLLVMLGAAIPVALLATTHPSFAAEPPPISAVEKSAVQRIAASAVSAPVKFRAVKMKVIDALAAVAPGENPMGDLTASIADHDAVVMSATGAGLARIPMAAPPGYKGDHNPIPLGILLIVDVTDNSQLGGTYVLQENDLARVDLSAIRQRGPASTETEIDVPPKA